jgi:DNA-binding NarL/FixJ family response regulator
MASETIYIALIEDNPHVRQGWEIVLNDAEHMKVIGAYANCEDALASTAIGEADVVLMDIGLPGMSGIEGVRHLKERYPQQVIVMCTVHEDDDKIFDALCAGAVGYLLKKTAPSDLIKALREAYSGGSPMTPSVARKVISFFQRSPADSVELSEKEQQILQAMAQGKTYAVIADELCLSVDGVYYHIRHIYEKLQVHSRAEAVAVGIKKHLIPPPR